jgi:Arc/MetJ family transcription regulator
MAGKFVDINVLGDEALARKLRKLPLKSQKKAVRPALRASAKRVKKYVIDNISGSPLAVVTGSYREAWRRSKVRVGKQRRGRIAVGIVYPTRSELDISPGDKYYYPFALEYGRSARGRGTKNTDAGLSRSARGTKDVRAIPHVRPAVDDHARVEKRLIGVHIGREIEKLARKV